MAQRSHNHSQHKTGAMSAWVVAVVAIIAVSIAILIGVYAAYWSSYLPSL